MKKPSQTILLLLIFAALAMAGTTTVDFTSLALPVNINGIPTSVTGVGFQYEPGGSLNNPPPSNCNFDAGLGGTQFFDFVNFPGGCVGAQVDSITGLSGTTDGSYALSFSSQVWNLHLVYGMLSLLTPAPLDTDYALNAILFDGPNMVGIAGAVGPGGTLDTASF